MAALLLFLVSLATFHYASGIKYVITTPNTIRIGAQETFAASISEHPGPVKINIVLQEYPGKKTITSKEVTAHSGLPVITQLSLQSKDLSARLSQEEKLFVNVVISAANNEFPKKEVVIPVTKYSGYSFVQTDKPLYLPNQQVYIRILHLDEALLPSTEPFTLDITNPQGTRVMHKGYLPDPKGITETTFKFPALPLFGNWSVTVRYGFQLSAKSTVRFEVKDYVLPTFSVNIIPPKIILNNERVIKGRIEAFYVYGKPVEGFTNLEFKVRNPLGIVTSVGTLNYMQLRLGVVNFNIRVEKDLKSRVKWFPDIDQSVFVIEATVVEKATGKRETAMDDTSVFTRSPYVISLKRSMKDFKPGVPYQIQVDVRYVNHQQLKERIEVQIQKAIAIKSGGASRSLQQKQPLLTDSMGRVVFHFDTEPTDQELQITVKTKDDALTESNQAIASMTIRRYSSPVKDTYVWIASPPEGTFFKVGKTFQAPVTIYPPGQEKMYYLVVSKGRILLMNAAETQGGAMVRTVQFPITAEMVPTFRLIVYIIKDNHIISDSLQLEVEKTCKYNEGKEFKITAYSSSGLFDPGNDVNFKIHAEVDSHVGLVAVDEAIYLLNKRDLLTKEKMFKEMDNHDLGAGPGGGSDPANVFRLAGVLVLSNAAVGDHRRTEAMSQVHQRKKRSIMMEMTVDNYTKEGRLCCRLGQLEGPQGMDCSDRAAKIYEAIRDQHNCSSIFLECCQTFFEYKAVVSRLGHSSGQHKFSELDNLEDPKVLIDRVEQDVIQNIRRIFPETWFFNTYKIGGQECRGEDRRVCEIKFAAPHSITTWMVQAVGISKTNGMCVADPLRLQVFKPMFIQLDLPKVAVRGEQIEIIATIFNYGNTDLKVTVYMKGVEGICMGAGPGERSEMRTIDVEQNSAASVTFPIMPLVVSEFPLQVIALSWSSSDAIEKKLQVVHEGVPVEKSLSFMLDPTGIYSRRKKRNVIDEGSVREIYDEHLNKQSIQVDIDLPDDHVPGTEQCYVSAIGNAMGQAMNTTLQGVEGHFLRIPTGCGEQTMIHMAPLVYTMMYLKKSGQLSGTAETKGYDYMWKGYAHQLTYRKPDGSFAIWAKNHESSTWLTAFVGKVFCQANSYIDISTEHMCASVSWMLQRQRDSGAFYDAYKVHHVEMTGGVQGDIGMTAYVLISMLECNECNSSDKKIAVTRAVAYLEEHVAGKHRPYTTALLAYALALAKSSKAKEANDKLKKLAVFDAETFTRYWNWDATEFGTGRKPWVYQKNPSAVAVETTSYALLTQLLYEDLEYSHAIVNWLNKQRSGSGSFVSTQDTVMALQALAEYNTRAKIPSLDIQCNISSSAVSRIRRSKPILLKQGTSTLLEEIEVPAKGKLHFDVTGKGLGTASVTLRYNVEQSPEKSCKFELTVKSEEYRDVIKPVVVQSEFSGIEAFIPDMVVRSIVSEKEAKDNFGYQVDNANLTRFVDRNRAREESDQGGSQHVIKLTICTKYLDNRVAGMSILDIGLFTGYKPMKEDLKLLSRSRATSKVGNFEESDRSVIIYFDEVPHDKPHCIELRTMKALHVGKVQPTAVKIYDYYEPEKACTKFYGPDGQSAMLKKICEGKQCFCLEGMCPPCTPFKHVADMDKEYERRKELLHMACDKHNYVWNGTFENEYKNGSFRYLQYRISEVVKEGVQKTVELKKQMITFVARDACQCPRIQIGKVYIIMGMDGSPYKTEQGEVKFKYIIDKNTSVYNSKPLRELNKKGQQLQKSFNSVYYRFVHRGEGCDQ